eukprot:PhM_4_TR6751/c0_g1_i1/m.90743
MVFTVLVACDLFGEKQNTAFEFSSVPPITDLVRLIEQTYDQEATMRRPASMPNVPFKVAAMQMYSEVEGRWIDVKSPTQLSDRCQVYAFQRDHGLHADKQGTIPPARFTVTARGGPSTPTPQSSRTPTPSAQQQQPSQATTSSAHLSGLNHSTTHNNNNISSTPNTAVGYGGGGGGIQATVPTTASVGPSTTNTYAGVGTSLLGTVRPTTTSTTNSIGYGGGVGGTSHPDSSERVKYVFDHMDHHRNATIDYPGLRSALTSLGIDLNGDVLEGIFQLADTNNDGGISYTEWQAFARSHATALVEALYHRVNSHATLTKLRDDMRSAQERLAQKRRREEELRQQLADAQREAHQAEVSARDAESALKQKEEGRRRFEEQERGLILREVDILSRRVQLMREEQSLREDVRHLYEGH